MKWFKHILMLSCVLLLTTQQAKADGDFNYGENVFQTGKSYMCLGVYNDFDEGRAPVYLFTVMLKSTKQPIDFPRYSKLFVQFSNDSVIELKNFGRVINVMETGTEGVERSDAGIEYQGRVYNPYDDTPYSEFSKPILLIYYTGRNYQLNDTDLQKLLMWRIVKVQVELSGGEKKEIKVGKSKGKKMLKKLQASWQMLQNPETKK